MKISWMFVGELLLPYPGLTKYETENRLKKNVCCRKEEKTSFIAEFTADFFKNTKIKRIQI